MARGTTWPGADRSAAPPPTVGGVDRLLLVGLGLATFVAVVVWMTGQVAALVSHGRWLPTTVADVASIMGRLPSHAGDPGDAWPAAAQGELPAAPWLYGIAAVITALLGAAVLAGAKAAAAAQRRRPNGLGRPARGAHWAGGHELAHLDARRRPGRAGARRVVLGKVGRRLIALEQRHSVLVLGPTQSGKTTALAIPALLEWDGPVVATSVKGDLVAHTRAYRQSLGRAWVFDPTGTAGAGPTARWSPLVEADTWSGAQRVANALVDAAPAQGGLSDGAFWFAASTKLLAPLLLAAARAGRSMTDVVRWTNLQETEEVHRVLTDFGEPEAVEALYASAGRDERIRSSIYTTLETVLAPYEDPVVGRSAEEPDFDPGLFLEGRNTLYLCGPAHEQARVQGVFSALVGSIVHAAAARHHLLGRPLDPPLLLVLDEVANIAPIKELGTLASTGAEMGMQLVTVCQDLAQLSTRYGPERCRTIANNHRAKVILSGIADIGTLDTVSGLAGEQAVREVTETSDLREGRHSRSSAIAYRRLAPADELRRIKPGEAVLIYGHLPPARLVLRPWYSDRQLTRRATRD